MADTQDFESVALTYLPSVYRTALALCGRTGEAEDLTQATYLKALQRFDTFRSGTSVKAWLVRILRNTWIDELRHRKVVGPTVTADDLPLAQIDEPDEPAWSNATDLLENFSDRQVIEALRALPDDQRLTLFLVDVELLSQEDVAEILDVAVGTVKSRVSRARSTLRTSLAAHARDLGFAGRRERCI